MVRAGCIAGRTPRGFCHRLLTTDCQILCPVRRTMTSLTSGEVLDGVARTFASHPQARYRELCTTPYRQPVPPLQDRGHDRRRTHPLPGPKGGLLETATSNWSPGRATRPSSPANWARCSLRPPTENERDLVANTPRILRVTARFSDFTAGGDSALRPDHDARHGGVPAERDPRRPPGRGSTGPLLLPRRRRGRGNPHRVVLRLLRRDREAAPRASGRAVGCPSGQGLQMINILKDIWEDHRRGACWLPRDIFRAQPEWNSGPSPPGERIPASPRALMELVAITRRHLANALRYILIIPAAGNGDSAGPASGPWVIAILTLQRIRRTPGFTSGREVKVSRRTVGAVVVVCNVFARSNLALGLLFKLLSPRPSRHAAGSADAVSRQRGRSRSDPTGYRFTLRRTTTPRVSAETVGRPIPPSASCSLSPSSSPYSK